MQQELMLFPLDIVNEYPPSEQTADYCGEVEAVDGSRYYVKNDSHGKCVRASEWICTKLAEEVGIAGASPALIRTLDGRLLFGSRRLSGAGDRAGSAKLDRAISGFSA